MKKNYIIILSAALFCSASHILADNGNVANLKSATLSSQAKKAFANRAEEASEELIKDRPVGTYNNKLTWTSEAYFEYNNAAQTGQIAQRTCEIVVNGTDFYLRNPISEFRTDTWLKGTIDENGNVTIPTPQLIYEDTYLETTYQYYLSRMIPGEAPNDYTIVYVPDTEQTDLHFIYKNGDFYQTDDDVLLGLTNSEGAWTYYGDKNIVVDKFDVEINAPENISTMEMNPFVIRYDSQGKPGSGIFEMGIDGDIAWIHNITSLVDDCWIKGNIKDDKIIIKGNQYLGANVPESIGPSYHTYLLTATSEERTSSDGRLTWWIHTEVPEITFTKTADNTYTTEGTIIINIGNNGIDKITEMQNSSISPYQNVALAPAKPVILDYKQYQESEYCGSVTFMLKPEAANGEYLNPNNIYYNIFLDTPDQPYALTQEEYPLLPVKEIVDIPYYFNDGTAIYRNNNTFTFVFYPQGLTWIGIQAYYQDGDNVKKAEISWINLEDGSTQYPEEKPNAITEIDAESNEVIAYFDLTGRKINNPEKGIYIAKTKSGKTFKVALNK